MKRVTVAVLAYNEEANLPDLLASMQKQTFPRELFEILIVDNGSSDGTRDVVRQWQGKLENLNLTNEPLPGIAVARNRALREAETELIAFTDADVICPPTWLQTLVEGFDRHQQRIPQLVAVGGGNVPIGDGGKFLQALGITLNSFWGSHGSAQGMIHECDIEVPHIPTLNLMYDRLAALDAGGFDENFRMVSEDPELNHRLTRAGRKIVYLAGAAVEHKMRPNLRSWMRNVYLYGRGRTQIIKKHPDHFSWKFAVPPLCLPALAVIPLGLVHPIFLLPLLYFVATLLISAMLCAKVGKLELIPIAFIILAGNPIAYGVGMFHGLWYRYPPAMPRVIPD
jgi:glycosyltransferase involved in cell wall biosynthesis